MTTEAPATESAETNPTNTGTRGTTQWTALLPTDFSVSHVQIGEWNTRVLQAGSGSETILLLHGIGGHLEAYARNVGFFAQRYRVIAVDYAGHGFTTHTTRPLELHDYVQHVLGILDHFGLGRVHISGESLGGWIAVKLAAGHPERVGKLALNTPAGALSLPEVRERIRSLSQGAADDPSRERIRARLEWLMADPATVTEELIDIRQAVYARPGFAESMRNIMCLQDEEVRRRNMITDDDLARVKSETLVVWTSNDPSGPAKTGLEIAEKLENGRFELITGAGHWPQYEQADRFNSLVSGFLAG